MGGQEHDELIKKALAVAAEGRRVRLAELHFMPVADLLAHDLEKVITDFAKSGQDDFKRLLYEKGREEGAAAERARLEPVRAPASSLSPAAPALDEILPLCQERYRLAVERIHLLLETVFTDPRAALRHLNEILMNSGIEQARQMLAEHPADLGRMRGGRFLGASLRRQARRAAGDLPAAFLEVMLARDALGRASEDQSGRDDPWMAYQPAAEAEGGRSFYVSPLDSRPVFVFPSATAARQGMGDVSRTPMIAPGQPFRLLADEGDVLCIAVRPPAGATVTAWVDRRHMGPVVAHKI